MVSTVEMDDPRMNNWTVIESMNNCRGYSAAAVIGNSIFAIGGWGEDDVLDTVCNIYMMLFFFGSGLIANALNF